MLCYPWLSLEWLGFPLVLTQTLQVLARSSLPRQIFNFSSNHFTCFEKTAKEFTSDTQTTRNTRKIANKFMTEASREINLQKQRSHLSGMAKVKAASSAHSMADVIPFLAYLIFPLIQALIKPKNIFFTHYKENNIHNIFCLSTFQQLFPNTTIFSMVVISQLMA